MLSHSAKHASQKIIRAGYLTVGRAARDWRYLKRGKAFPGALIVPCDVRDKARVEALRDARRCHRTRISPEWHLPRDPADRGYGTRQL